MNVSPELLIIDNKDGQTERVNQCLENYLRCMCFNSPKRWHGHGRKWARLCPSNPCFPVATHTKANLNVAPWQICTCFPQKKFAQVEARQSSNVFRHAANLPFTTQYTFLITEGSRSV